MREIDYHAKQSKKFTFSIFFKSKKRVDKIEPLSFPPKKIENNG